MALTDENGMVMPVSPMNGGNGGFGFGNGDLSWLVLLFLMFGFGNRGFYNGGNGDMGGGMYPWMNQAGTMNSGFSSIQNSLATGFGDVQNSLCSGFAGVNAAITGAQMSLLPQLFGIQSAQQQCCCENRAAIADVKYTIANEACADRAAVTAGVQRILDQLCNDKIDAKNERIADLERQLTMANLAASQTAQTSRILADNAAQTVALEQYLNPVPIPSYPANNPRCCTQSAGCPCSGTF